MNTLVFISFLILGHISVGQTSEYYHLEITYDIHGLGSNLGDSSRVFSVDKNKLYSNLPELVHENEVSTEDTAGRKYIYYDSVYYISTTQTSRTLRTSSVDSIYNIVKYAKGRLGGGNFCVRSGSAHYLYFTADGIGSRVIQMFNTFDSTAFLITNIILSNLPENTREFRPLEMWESAIKCNESLKESLRQFEAMSEEEQEAFLEKRRNNRNKRKESQEKPIDRSELIQKSLREELNTD